MTGSTPADMINLRLILVSGKTKEFLFSPNDSAADIAKHVYDNWPMDWEEEQVSSPNILRLIYQGRFLHGNVTLGALKLPLGKTTVMHLVARETLPEPNSQGNQLPVSPFSFQEAFHMLNNVKCSAPSHYLFLHMASVLGAATSANNWLLEVYPQDTTHCVEYTANINHARRFASFFYDYDK
uniref:Ubiquitin-like protein 3 n=1 Tax=Oreochromis niloticus TaxID=8128 RepID=A0A669CAR1_ORENI